MVGLRSVNSDDSLRYSLVPPETVLQCSLNYYCGTLFVERFSIQASLQNDDFTRKCVNELVLTRSRDGGLRFGEMERDCMIAHGASAVLKERLYDVSDPFQMPICCKCGIITSTSTMCQGCNSDNVRICRIPYAAKQLIMELSCLNMELRFKPSE